MAPSALKAAKAKSFANPGAFVKVTPDPVDGRFKVVYENGEAWAHVETTTFPDVYRKNRSNPPADRKGR